MKRYIGQVWKDSKYRSSYGVWGTQLSLNVSEFTNLEAL